MRYRDPLKEKERKARAYAAMTREEKDARLARTLARRRKSMAAYAEKHRERILAYKREWRLKHPERHRVQSATWNAHRQRRIQGTLSADLIPRLMQLQQGRCQVCHGGLQEFHLDHIEPLVRGGRHEDANMQLLCVPCNRKKSSKDPIRFMQEQGYLL